MDAVLPVGVFTGLHAAGVCALYKLLPAPSVSSGTAEGLCYVLKRVIGPIFATQWFIFEFKAISRLFLKDKPWSSFGGEEKPSTAAILDRIQHNSFEQSVMTTASA